MCGSCSWTPLPQSEWHDPFTPTYIDAEGNILIGEPEPATTPYDPGTFVVTTDPTEVTAIQNEALINFHPSVSPGRAAEILSDFRLDILFSSMFTAKDDPCAPDSEVAYFHVRVLPESPHFDDVPQLLAALQPLPEVRSATPNVVGTHFVPPNDPLFPSQRYLEHLRVVASWDQIAGANNSTVPIGVVVLDTGVEVDHPDLAARIYRHPKTRKRMGATIQRAKDGKLQFVLAANIDSAKNKAALVGRPVPPVGVGVDLRTHGTAVAGVIAAHTGNSLGVASCTPSDPARVTVFPVRFTSQSFPSDVAPIIVAAQHFSAQLKSKTYPNLKVVSMSIGWQLPGELELAIQTDIRKNDRLYVGAAGNLITFLGEFQSFPGGTPIFPAAFSSVLGVTGVRRDANNTADVWPELDPINNPRVRSNYLDENGQPSTRAFGVSAYLDNFILTTDLLGTDGLNPVASPAGDYVDTTIFLIGDTPGFGGTSAAAPQVAALAALLFFQNRNRVASEVRAIIEDRSLLKTPSIAFVDPANSQPHVVPGVIDFLNALAQRRM
jgi:subtilisin family serine protease